MAWVLDGAHVVLFDLLGWAPQKTDGARKNMEPDPFQLVQSMLYSHL